MIRTFIVSDTRLYLDGLKAVLGMNPRIDVLGGTSGDDALYQISRFLPDVVLLDRCMDDSIGVGRAISTRSSRTKIVLLAVPDVEDEILACAQAGFVAYVPKSASFEDLISVIREVARGEFHCSPKIVASLLRSVARHDCGSARDHGHRCEVSTKLTSREKLVLGQIEEGCSNKEISAALGIEVATVKNHVHNILEKLNVSTRGEAAAYARRTGVCSRTAQSTPAPAYRQGDLDPVLDLS